MHLDFGGGTEIACCGNYLTVAVNLTDIVGCHEALGNACGCAKEFVFTDAGQMADGDVSVEHVLLFTANTASIEEDSSHTFYVKVDFEQKD